MASSELSQEEKDRAYMDRIEKRSATAKYLQMWCVGWGCDTEGASTLVDVR